MTKLKKNASLRTMLDDAACAAAEYGKWPEVPARGEIADREIGHLRQLIAGYDSLIVSALILEAVATHNTAAYNLDIDKRPEALRRGLIKLMDMLFVEEDGTGRKDARLEGLRKRADERPAGKEEIAAK